MLLTLCKSKISRATVTRTDLHYDGSITLDSALMEAAGMLPYERVQVLNLNNGERLETYLLPGPEKSGTVCLNGPAARCGEVGDIVTIISYVVMEKDECRDWKPAIVQVDEKNRVVKAE